MSLSRLRVGQKLVLAMAVTILVSFVVAGVVIQRVAGRHAIKTAEEFSGTVNAQVVGKRLSIGVIAGWSAMRYRSAGGFRRSAASTGAV